MPSIHIPEESWTEILLQEEGDREQARERVKEAVKREAQNNG